MVSSQTFIELLSVNGSPNCDYSRLVREKCGDEEKYGQLEGEGREMVGIRRGGERENRGGKKIMRQTWVCEIQKCRKMKSKNGDTSQFGVD